MLDVMADPFGGDQEFPDDGRAHRPRQGHFQPVKKNGKSDFQMISRAITASPAPAMRAMLTRR